MPSQTQNNFIVLDYDGNEVFENTPTTTRPVTPNHRYELRSRTRTTTLTPSAPQKPTHTRSVSSEIARRPLLFQGHIGESEPVASVQATAVNSQFEGTIVYEAEDGSIVLRGFTGGLEFFTARGATEDETDEELEETEDETDEELEEIILDGFTYEEYGRGFLLYPPMDHPAIGEKYFFDAWWMPKFDAWFFKEEHLDNFTSMGVTEYHTHTSEEEEEEEEVDDELFEETDEETDEETGEGAEDDLSEFCYVQYGRGYLLFAPEGHPNNGTKYFYNSWWMPKYNGWFFQKKFLEEFIEMGVVEGEYSDDEESDTETEDIQEYEEDEETEDEETETEDDNDLSGFTYEAYGRGFLLFAPEEGHPEFGTKYFHDAWWMPKHDAWFFRRQHLDNFLEMGVTLA